MKRTAERVLGIIGVIMMSIGALLVTILTIGFTSPDSQRQIETMLQDPEINPTGEDIGFDQVIDYFVANGWIVVVALVASIVLGIVASVLVKKKPVFSGIMWLLAAVISLVTIWYLIILPAILFVIAGILALVRKAPPENPEEPART
ncbi:DUF4064 domain-containing protein [Alkalicoccobacillus murimartini]|uniref:ABC-type nickel/cobalt efflux system permease component RcnA n=1 Tax=Alkalicoccobacillus murimartini TaxID=171685 RepID=A0ABT9YGY4_9BACI|nr:DUF4064 domain-containing protein [Alkalicoccobacillus murimartini]MDQ0207127.1 ABC-type nickel/cobalt efflux system permease component RcnA [Alkalicoccobacillus murimartini]